MTRAISPLIAAGSRFPVGTGEPVDSGQLCPEHLRSFLLRGAESVQHTPFDATPQTTTGYDGTPDDESEDFNQPDFSP